MSRPVPIPTAEPRWLGLDQLRSGLVPVEVSAWLNDRGSLTRAVVTACDGAFGVRLLSQGWGRGLPSERALLDQSPGRLSLVREVELLCGTEPWVFARTLIPATSLRGAARRLARLHNRPLGAVLFADPATRRLKVQVTRLTAQHALYHAACSHLDALPEAIWGRRTLFSYAEKPLLVNEIFLPAIPASRS